MTVEERFKKRYEAGSTPWDVGMPDFNLIDLATGFPIPSGKALDAGCGTGDNSIWLAQNGFTVVGVDVSDIALDKARAKAAEAGVGCDFRLANIMESPVGGAPFDFIFDRGCLHLYGSDEERSRFARKAAEHLVEGGMWLSLLGNIDEDRQGPGPPQRSAREIVLAVEPVFEILKLETTEFGSNRPNPPRAWRCLMRKRRQG